MKLEHPVHAPTDGVISDLRVDGRLAGRAGSPAGGADARLRPRKEPPLMDFDYTPEQQRPARRGRRSSASATATSTSCARPRPASTPTSCGTRRPSSATSASACPRSTAAAAAASPSSPSSARSWPRPAARCCCSSCRRRSRRPSSPARHRRRSGPRWLPGFADGTRRSCFAITEPDAGLQLPPAGHRGPPGRRRLRHHRPQGVHLRRRRGSQVVRGGPDGRRAHRQAQAGAVRRAHRRARADAVQARHGDRVAGEPVPALLRRRAGAGRRPGRRGPGGRRCRRCSPA